MVSPEQVEAWQSRIQKISGLTPEEVSGLSLVKFRMEEALRPPIVVPDVLDSSLREVCSGSITPDFRPILVTLKRFFIRAAAIF